jgi:hypothetical protein
MVLIGGARRACGWVEPSWSGGSSYWRMWWIESGDDVGYVEKRCYSKVRCVGG